MIFKSTIYGFIGMTALMAVYFSVVSLISGWQFALSQFSQFRYFIVSLALGFGVQIALYVYLKNSVGRPNSSGKVVTISGTTSTVVMISCCSHYLVNILPVISITSFISIISQYQIELFWVGIMANGLGILYMLRKIFKVSTSVYLASRSMGNHVGNPTVASTQARGTAADLRNSKTLRQLTDC